MKTIVFKNRISAIATMALLFVSLFTATAQEDPLKNVPGIQKLEIRNKFYADRELRAAPQLKAKIKSLRDEVTEKKFTFEVAYTAALDLKESELVGTLQPKPINLDIVKQQEDFNKKLEVKARLDMQKLKIKEPNVSAVSAIPSCYVASAFFSPVKNQGGCGSCWAFAAAAQFEHTHKKFYGTVPNLSEQDMVSCGKTCAGIDAGSCGGGHSFRAFDYIRCFGNAKETSFPYTATNGVCVAKPKTFWAYFWSQLTNSGGFPTRDQIKSRIQSYGAVVTYMKAGVGSFQAYKSGVYNGYPSNNTHNIDHAVIIVGWCDQMNAWIIKNSWGTGWGINGYAYVNYNACNIGKYVYYAYPRKSGGAITAPQADGVGEESPIASNDKN
jgi:cathepsin L